MLRFSFFLFFIIFFNFKSYAQVNGYARVTGLSGGNTVLTVNNVNETFGTFENGARVIVIQMQNATLSGTSDNSSFGAINSIGSTGLWEIATILSHTESGGLPTTITLTSALANTYSTDATSARLQVITFPTLGSPNFTTTANITAVSWNGEVGGIVAFRVAGKLFLNHNITTDVQGFRGGLRNGNDGGGCAQRWRVASAANAAFKGEGVYRGSGSHNPAYNNTGSNRSGGQAKIANGGGGGSTHNGGGGGGGHYTAGGDGGPGFSGALAGCSPTAGGQGGVSLSSFVSSGRFFMGGGGGGGQENNSVGNNGVAGGGIVYIEADSIIVTGACSGRRISANGGDAQPASNDGGGGGGAAGTVYLNVQGFRVASGCPLVVSADGGDGGDVNHVDTHGGGGGGAQGVVYIPAPGVFTNATFRTLNGDGGTNNNLSGGSTAGNGGGTNNDGIFQFTVLPVTFGSQSAYWRDDRVVVEWKTLTEVNADRFLVYKSADGVNWEYLDYRYAAGNSSHVITYFVYDFEPYDVKTYYLIQQYDLDGTKYQSDIIIYREDGVQQTVALFPNPAKEKATVSFTQKALNPTFEVYDLFGKVFTPTITKLDNGQYEINTDELSSGIYFVKIVQGSASDVVRLVVE